MRHDELDERLAALESRVPATGTPPRLGRRASVRRLVGARPGLVAVGLTLTLSAAVAAGAVVEGLGAHGHPGIQNKGQPLQGAHMECMTPPRAAAFLARKGYADVIWQVESGSGKDGRSVQQRTAPQHGYVVPGAIIDGVVYMVVDQRDDATGTGACFKMEMP